jgi:hypothetical protein
MLILSGVRVLALRTIRPWLMATSDGTS